MPVSYFSHCKSLQIIIYYSLTLLELFSLLLDHFSGCYLTIIIPSFLIKLDIERWSRSTADYFNSTMKRTIDGIKKKKRSPKREPCRDSTNNVWYGEHYWTCKQLLLFYLVVSKNQYFELQHFKLVPARNYNWTANIANLIIATIKKFWKEFSCLDKTTI